MEDAVETVKEADTTSSAFAVASIGMWVPSAADPENRNAAAKLTTPMRVRNQAPVPVSVLEATTIIQKTMSSTAITTHSHTERTRPRRNANSGRSTFQAMRTRAGSAKPVPSVENKTDAQRMEFLVLTWDVDGNSVDDSNTAKAPSMATVTPLSTALTAT